MILTKKSVEAFMSGQSSQSLGTAKLLAGPDYVHRYNVMMPKNRFKLDGVKEILSLKGLGYSEARKALPKLEDIFFQVKAKEFIPFHQLIIKAV